MPKFYECEQCRIRFERKYDLKRHMTIHTGVKEHKCSECGAAFAQRSALKIHFNTHTGAKPFVCEFCCRGFNDPSSHEYAIAMNNTAISNTTNVPRKSAAHGAIKRRAEFAKHLRKCHQLCNVPQMNLKDYGVSVTQAQATPSRSHGAPLRMTPSSTASDIGEEALSPSKYRLDKVASFIEYIQGHDIDDAAPRQLHRKHTAIREPGELHKLHKGSDHTSETGPRTGL
ncbi:Zinc finger protein Gfi-1b [Grifola frondosa]|uniref:Zinc finger protein Gfi-1b n=1 Tax=Grifola frondosa TaxID=5627 RepID=A0A1C7ML36_GRIFR|nr:Zinc finger protein Gfi-1b [Grifola frondosa]